MNWIWNKNNNYVTNSIIINNEDTLSSNNTKEMIYNNSNSSNSCNNIKSNWDYRRFITLNGLDIIKSNTNISYINSGLNPRIYSKNNINNNSPILLSSTNSKKKFNIYNSDLSNSYIKKEQIQSRMITPIIKINNHKEY